MLQQPHTTTTSMQVQRHVTLTTAACMSAQVCSFVQFYIYAFGMKSATVACDPNVCPQAWASTIADKLDTSLEAGASDKSKRDAASAAA